jgi:tetratricopeptide (TPR) repeat protein
MVFSFLEQGRNCPMVQKKHKVLMTDEETGDKFILVDEYPVTRYKCGLKAGDQVRLKKDLVGFDHKYRPTGKVDAKGQIWTVLKGSIVNGNVDMWFRKADGELISWDDDRESVATWFELTTRANKRSAIRGQKELLTPKPHVHRIYMAGVYSKRGSNYLSKRQYSKAIANYDKALKSDPRYGPAYCDRGAAYLRKGKLDKAKADLDKALRLGAMGEIVYYHRGAFYEAIGKHGKAMADYTKVINLNPTDADAYIKRGRIYYKKGNLDKALADYSKAIEINPKYVAAYMSRERTYFAKGQYDKAIADLSKVIKMNPSDAVAYNNRAVAFFYKKEIKSARDDVSKAQALGFKVHPEFLKELQDAAEPRR